MQELPSWVVNGAQSAAVFGHGRLKLTLIALSCILLGYLFTSAFSPIDDVDALTYQGNYDFASAGILEGPTVFPGAQQSPDGPPDSEARKSKNKEWYAEEGNVGRPGRRPSIKGALSDLHHAVSDKVTSWKPWSQGLGIEANITSEYDATSTRTANLTLTGAASLAASAFSAPLKSEEILDPEQDLLGHKTRIGKCTIVLYGSSIYERSVQTHSQHDRLHGYPLFVLRQSIMDDVWSKPAYVLSLLLRELAKPQETRLQWLLWIDADTILLNPYIPLEVFLPPSPQFDDIHLLITHDWNGLNNGVFPIRVCQWSVELMSAIVSYRHYNPDKSLTFRDQSAMDTLLQDKKFAAHTVEAPQRWFNAYQGEHNETLAPYQVRRGDLLVHFAGVINRDERILFWLDRAEQHLPEWEVEVQHTSYPAEIKDFWGQRAQERRVRQVELAEARTKASELLSQIDSRMTEYQDRITPSEAAYIKDQQSAVRLVIEQGDDTLEVTSINAALSGLEQSLNPLNEAAEKANKVLMKEAHDAIFAAENDAIEQAGSLLPEVAEIEAKATSLKNLVVQPDWKKSDLSDGIEALKQARANLQQKLQEQEIQNQALREAEEKANEERKRLEEQLGNPEETPS